MASKKLKYSEIAEKGLLEPLIKDVERLNTVLMQTEKQLKEVIASAAKAGKTNPLESYKDAQEAEEGIRKTKKAVEDLDKVEKQRIKLQEQLIELEDARIQKNFELREEINKQRKALRQQAKDAVDGVDAYKKLTRATNEAQLNFKKLAAQFGATSKEAKQAQKEFAELDDELREINEAAKDGKRDVGRYEQGVSKLRGSVQALTKATIVLEILKGLQTAFSQNTKAAGEFNKILGSIGAAFSVIVERLLKFGPAVYNNVTAIFLDAKVSIAELKLEAAELFDVLGSNSKSVDKAREALGKLKAEQAAGSKETANLSDIFSGIFDEITKRSKAFSEYVDKNIEARKATIALSKEVAELREQQARLQVQSGDNTLTLEQQAEATIKLGEVEAEIAAKEVKYLQERADAAAELAKSQSENLDAAEAAAEVFVELEEKKAEATALAFENAKVLREIERDNMELDLDQLIDLADRRKTINEQIATDESKSFEDRRKALDDTTADLENSLRVQAEKIAEGTGVILDIDSLLSEKDTEELNKRIKSLGFDEIRQNRLREILQERLQAVQDLDVAQRELTDAERESNKVGEDSLLIEGALIDLKKSNANASLILQKLEEARLSKEIELLRMQIPLETENAERRIALQQELNEKLLEQARAGAEERAKVREEIAEAGFAALEQLNAKFGEKRLAGVDEQLAESEKRVERLRELADKGSVDAQQSLAREQQRQAQLALERERELQRQKKFELSLAAIQVYSAKVKGGQEPTSALTSTVADIEILQRLIDVLPGFKKGIEDTGTGGILRDKDGAITGYTHENERVLTAEQNKLVGGMSNLELALLARDSRIKSKEPKFDNGLKEEIRRARLAVEQRPVNEGLSYDSVTRIAVDIVKKGNRREREHKKVGGIWGK